MTNAESDPSNIIFIFFPTEEKVGIELVRTYVIWQYFFLKHDHSYVQRMKDANVKRAIIVLRPPAPPAVSKELSAQVRKGIQQGNQKIPC